MAAPSTASLVQKPRNGGMPASDAMMHSTRPAIHGLRAFRPLKSSMFSASKPARDSAMIAPKAAVDMIA
ncbi:hypothetical protein D3C86_2035600 [compost metagenome]